MNNCTTFPKEQKYDNKLMRNTFTEKAVYLLLVFGLLGCGGTGVYSDEEEDLRFVHCIDSDPIRLEDTDNSNYYLNMPQDVCFRRVYQGTAEFIAARRSVLVLNNQSIPVVLLTTYEPKTEKWFLGLQPYDLSQFDLVETFHDNLVVEDSVSAALDQANQNQLSIDYLKLADIIYPLD